MNPLCQTSDFNGACLTCYPGYSLSEGVCGVARLADPNCKSTNKNGNCLECYSGYFFNTDRNSCVALNPLCKSSNMITGDCLSCYPGYKLSIGSCSVFFKDPNCQEYDADNLCESCSDRHYVNPSSGLCVSVSPLCKGYNLISGACLTCYQGYTLSTDKCVVGTSSNTDVNCKTFNGKMCV